MIPRVCRPTRAFCCRDARPGRSSPVVAAGTAAATNKKRCLGRRLAAHKFHNHFTDKHLHGCRDARHHAKTGSKPGPDRSFLGLFRSFSVLSDLFSVPIALVRVPIGIRRSTLFQPKRDAPQVDQKWAGTATPGDTIQLPKNTLSPIPARCAGEHAPAQRAHEKQRFCQEIQSKARAFFSRRALRWQARAGAARFCILVAAAVPAAFILAERTDGSRYKRGVATVA